MGGAWVMMGFVRVCVWVVVVVVVVVVVATP